MTACMYCGVHEEAYNVVHAVGCPNGENERITTGGDHPDATEPHRTWYQLNEANRRITTGGDHNLEQDNAELRKENTKLRNTIKLMEETLLSNERIMRRHGIEI